MSLSKITKAEIAQWGNAGGTLKGFDVNVSPVSDRWWNGYDVSIVLLWAPDGEHDGTVVIGSSRESSLEECKRSAREWVDYTIKTYGNAKKLAEMAQALDFTGTVEDLVQKWNQSKG